MKAILLARISSDSQELDEQTNNLISFAKSEGYSDSDLIIIQDEESAINLSEEERNGLNRMKEYIANDSTINCVYVWELTRLTRIPKTGYNLRDYFLKNKVQLKNYTPSFQLLNSDFSDFDDNGSMLFAIYLNYAEQEMRTKKARFHRSKIRNARTGKYSGGFIKYGYYVDDKGYYQINEDQAELIRYVFDRYEQGISIIKLNKELIERGLTESLSFVNEALKCDAYTGLSNKYGMNRVYPQIISSEQFDRCKEIKKKNNKKLDKTNEVYFAKGLIKCKHCGAKYMAMKTSIQYLCYNRFGREQRLKPTLACRESPSININILDTILFEACVVEEAHYLMKNSEDRVENLKEQININIQKINTLKTNTAKSQDKKERNNTMYFNGAINEEKYLSNIKAVDAEVREANNAIVANENLNTQLQNRIEAIETSKKGFNRSYSKFEGDVYDIKDLKEKQQIVQRHIKEVTIDDEVPNHTKIINIFFYSYPVMPLQYRVHIKKMPQMIEINEAFYSEGYDETSIADWVKCNFKIEKRFVRKSSK